MSRLLTDDEITRQLADLPDWSRDGDTLRASYEAPDFLAGIRLVQEVAKEAEAHQRTVSGEIDARLLGEFRANSAVTVNDVDQAPFCAATAPVAERWETRPFGDFVKRLRAAAVDRA